MKTIAVRSLQQRLRRCIDASQGEAVVVTRHGKPAAVIVGVEGKDWEDALLQTNTSFWKLIEARRKERTLTLAKMRKRVGVRRAPRKSKR